MDNKDWYYENNPQLTKKYEIKTSTTCLTGGNLS